MAQRNFVPAEPEPAPDLSPGARSAGRKRLANDPASFGIGRLFDIVREGVVVAEIPSGRIVLWNPAAERMFGYSAKEAIGRQLTELMPERMRDLHSAGFRRYQERGTGSIVASGRVVELPALRRDGSEFYVELTLVSVQHRTLAGPFVLAVLRDITERKAAGASLKRSYDELEQFAHIVSHDLRQPLNSIHGFVQLLAERWRGQDAETDQFADHALEGIQRMDELLQGLLEYTKVAHERRPLVPVDLGKALGTALKNLEAARRESGARITQEAMPLVQGDLPLLTLVFQNLLSNAMKFRGTQPPCIHVTARSADGKWVIGVQDSGIGVDPQEAERIFKIFGRAHPGLPGAGIGLAICKKILDAHSGRIWVESQPEQGATFYFTLPALEHPPQEQS